MIRTRGLLLILLLIVLTLGSSFRPGPHLSVAGNKTTAVGNIPLDTATCSCGTDCGPPKHCSGDCSGDYGVWACVVCINTCCINDEKRECGDLQ